MSTVSIEVESAGTDHARWCFGQYYAELAERFEAGFDPLAGNTFHPDELKPPKGWFVMARRDGDAVGCGALKRLDDGRGEIKRVWIDKSARGIGLAGRIMDRLEALAREVGLPSVVLDTNKTLIEARTMYARRGYVEIDRYNDNPYADHWFELRF